MANNRDPHDDPELIADIAALADAGIDGWRTAGLRLPAISCLPQVAERPDGPDSYYIAVERAVEAGIRRHPTEFRQIAWAHFGFLDRDHHDAGDWPRNEDYPRHKTKRENQAAGLAHMEGTNYRREEDPDKGKRAAREVQGQYPSVRMRTIMLVARELAAPGCTQGPGAGAPPSTSTRSGGAEPPPQRTDRSPASFPQEPPAELFRPCPDGRARYQLEMAMADRERANVWWRLRPGLGVWLGEYFAFWRKAATTPCDEVTYHFDEQRPDYPLGDYGAARFGEDPDLDGRYKKATIVHASPGFLSDDEGKLFCASTNYDFSHDWAEANFQRLFEGPANPSVFGVAGHLAFPGIVCIHGLICTSDNYVVFSLRSTAPDFYKLRWSASFEEQMRFDRREFVFDRADGDRNVYDTFTGGLDEEFGVPASYIAAHTCLAVGRTYVELNPALLPGGDESSHEPRRMDIHCPVLTAVKLTILGSRGHRTTPDD